MSDADEAPETDPLAETVAPPQPSSDERSPSKHALHQRVRARLFEGAPPAEYEAGTMLAGRFRVVGLLGRGGMGEVYRARDLVLDEDVAIKFIPQELAHDKRFMERFVQEVRLARVVSHPNVCRVHDIGELDGRSYLSMEYIDGEDLASLLRRIGRLPAEKATELARQLCAGLAALHEHEILHRDLKPHNLMVDGRGQLKITDFGLAAQGHVADNELRDGTPAYMAPEQAAGREVTVRSDLFALGLILYEIFTGDRARAKGRDDSALSSELTSRSGNMPPEVIAVIEACLRAEPSARPNSALSVAAALPGGDPVAAALAAGRAPSVDALLNTDAGGALPRLWGTAIAAVAVVLLIVVAATFESTTYLGRSPSLSPEVLRHEASELLDASTGPLDRPREYRAMRFDRNVMETRRQDPDGAPLVLFDYRRQAVPFQPLHVLSITDPPYVAPGAARVTLDGNGQLRSLFVGDVRKQDDPTTMDWTPLFEAAGLESATLQPIEPRDISERDVDDVRAWQGTHPTWNAEVRIEAGSRQGRVVVFDVIPQWDPRYEDAASVTTQQPEGPGLISLFVVVLFGGLAWMARRAARDHGADTRSAFRITVAVGIVVTLSLVLDRNLVDGNDHRFVPRVVALLGSLLTTYWGYVALEPFARRFHPEAMTAWVRLVRGRVRDALVGRAVLLGASASIVAAALERLGSSIDGDLALYPATINTLDSLYTMVNAIAGPTAAAPILFILYIGLIRLVRNRAVASWIFVGIIVALFGAASYVGSGGGIGMTVGGAIAGGLWGLSIVRLGVLGLLSFQVVRNGVALLPMSLDFSAWFAPFSIAAMATILGLIVYGWRFGVAQSQPTST